MRKWIALLLALSLLLCGCTAAPSETTEATAEATTEPTTEPTTQPTTEPAPVYINPLNGKEMDEPLTNRIFAVTVSNVRDSLPHVGVNDADIVMEMFVNGSVIRCLALFTDVESVPTIGSVRSNRYMFTDIATHYDAVVAHAGGVRKVLRYADENGVSGFNIDTAQETEYSARDQARIKKGIYWEHCLVAKGEGLVNKALEQGIDMTQAEDKDYGMVFADDGTPAGGEDATKVNVTITFGSNRKPTSMQYDEELGKYVWHQYENQMKDFTTGEPEAFENVVIMLADIYMNQYGYHYADFSVGGTGYYACGGKIIPIQWSCEDATSPFKFTTLDGEPVTFGVGNTYIAISHPNAAVSYE